MLFYERVMLYSIYYIRVRGVVSECIWDLCVLVALCVVGIYMEHISSYIIEQEI